ncbi:hypothetical protein BX616_003972 [Lobosporangium transversale]|uniref:LITAF domain-containing protein n=1 Tax=Lobosporangium transversale TaxID=64571 RepID=A0A1Y2GSU6_9FUNG|nr:hypothetical protein BCR41DRAFT_351700 [Lobosporangium transversale]KAF9898470.1 hypothetical protein BX616_003972 [Lobosporangium transversale]ORZ19182.1 hypothetical protein BCR41DRAFT_351700 [Lobosporangium transversale]|eukprot:XP_021882350.1 hypothetical protein BCR41DRAFT_351700 [Lobosporangium transversale]
MTVSTFAAQPLDTTTSHTSFISSTSTVKKNGAAIGVKHGERLLKQQQQQQQQKQQPLSTTTATAVSTSSSTSTPMSPPGLFIPMWDYDRFPVGPSLRERRSHEQQNPFLIDYSNVPEPLSYNSHSNQASRRESREDSRNTSAHDLVAGSSSPSLSPSPFVDTDADADGYKYGHPSLTIFIPDQHHPQSHSLRHNHPAAHAFGQQNPPATLSKFDQYKAQMMRSTMTSTRTTAPAAAAAAATTAATSSFSAASPASSSSSSPSFPSSPQRADARDITPPSSVPSKKKRLSVLFKATSLSKKSKVASSKAEAASNLGQGIRRHSSPSSRLPSSGSLQSSLLGEKPSLSMSSLDTSPSMAVSQGLENGHLFDYQSGQEGGEFSNGPSQSLPTQPSPRSPLEEQQDRWREEWLRQSGAIHSLFRDRPSKFNCPHCGANKVVSHIQFVPGVMSYLVAFGLLFLTLGTLSYLPFRKGHEETKDCIHWCPECDQRVARFNRANATWEWI